MSDDRGYSLAKAVNEIAGLLKVSADEINAAIERFFRKNGAAHAAPDNLDLSRENIAELMNLMAGMAKLPPSSYQLRLKYVTKSGNLFVSQLADDGCLIYSYSMKYAMAIGIQEYEQGLEEKTRKIKIAVKAAKNPYFTSFKKPAEPHKVHLLKDGRRGYVSTGTRKLKVPRMP